MDNSTFQERVKRLKEINEVIKDLEPAIQGGALSLLAEYVTGYSGAQKSITQPAGGNGVKPMGDDTAAFFGKFPEGKPADNAVSIAAYLYSQYGAQPFKLEEMKEIAQSVGVTIPTSVNMTLNNAQRDGKSLFQHTGRSEYKPTVHGELYFKKTYQVTTGTKRRPAQAPES